MCVAFASGDQSEIHRGGKSQTSLCSDRFIKTETLMPQLCFIQYLNVWFQLSKTRSFLQFNAVLVIWYVLFRYGSIILLLLKPNVRLCGVMLLRKITKFKHRTPFLESLKLCNVEAKDSIICTGIPV